LERRVEIVRWLQGNPSRTGEIASHFGRDGVPLDERTIRSDLKALREGVDVFGTRIRIDSKPRYGHQAGQQHEFTSTVHPVMLALNLSELLALLSLLEQASEGVAGEVYQHLFDCVYAQLTGYAEARLADRLARPHNRGESANRLEEAWVEASLDYKLVYWQKSHRAIEVQFVDDQGATAVRQLRLVGVNRRNGLLTLQDDAGEEIQRTYGDIVIDWQKVDYR
jgi:hypothetical protein